MGWIIFDRSLWSWLVCDTVWDVMVVVRGHNVEEEDTGCQPSGWRPSMNASRGDGAYTDSLDRD